ncbi:MAG: WD40 repeat domain-containing protein [Planctomycetes bacterium]|nr:WD40 repeat domain-containing protein [Planctomycetota bacterium]
MVIYSVKLGRKEKELANVFIPQQHVPVVNVPELPPPILKEPAKTPKKIELNFDPRLGPLPVDAIAQIPLPEDIGEVIALRFSDDGKTLACGTQLEHACWIDVDKRKVIGVAPEAPKTQPFGNDVRTVSAISPDTTKVAVFPPHGRLSYFNRAESIEPIVLSKDSPNQPKIWNTAFSSDGKRLCSTHDDKTAQIWDVDKKAMIEKLDGYEDRVDAAAWSPDGSLLATTASNQVVIHDARTFNRLATLEVPKNEFPYFLDFDRNGKLLAAVYRQAVYFWPLERNGDQLEVGKRRDFRQVAQVKQIAFSPDGKFFISADSAGRVALRDIQTFEVKEDFFRDQRIVGYDRRGACAFRKQDGLLAVADLHRVVLFDLKTLRKK